MSQPAEPETNAEEQSTLPVKTEEGTILLTPEEIRAALDAGSWMRATLILPVLPTRTAC